MIDVTGGITVFENDKDLSRGLSRGENMPAEKSPEVSGSPIYTAYTQPADTSYNTAAAAEDAPPAVPPPQNQTVLPEEKEKSKRKRSRAFSTVLIVLALLFCAVGIFVLRYNVSITRTGSGFSVDIVQRGSEKTKPQSVPDLPDTQDEDNRPLLETAPAGTAGGNVRLDIEGIPAGTAAGNGALSYGEVYERCSPSIVSIQTETYSGSSGGSGVIMQSDGYIITNAHVIEGAYAISVTTSNGEQFPASIIGADSSSDLAVLKVDGKGLKPAEFGNSELMRVGDEVVAIGNPFSQTLTMTNGIISAINRDVTYNGNTMTLLQTNAAINEGNSGGPLINMYGQVIGITNMKLIGYYTSIEGIGYAIPSATVKTVVDELIDHGYVAGRPGIGVTLEEMPESALVYYGLPNGLYVRFVQEGSDAYLKDIRVGDMIVAINGVGVTTNAQVAEIKNQFAVGDSITITVYRNGVTFDAEVTLMDMGQFS